MRLGLGKRMSVLEARRAEARALGAEITGMIRELAEELDSGDPEVAAQADRVLGDLGRLLGVR